MDELKEKRIAVLSPVAWRTPPREYGAWETVASNIAEGLVARGYKNITLFATEDSITKGTLRSCIKKGYEQDHTQIPKVSSITPASMQLHTIGSPADYRHRSQIDI